MRKHELDAKIAALFDCPKRDVAHITEAFLLEVRKALGDGEVVRLDGLGSLRVTSREGVMTSRGSTRVRTRVRKYHVGFRQSDALKALVKSRRTTDGKVRRRRTSKCPG